MRSVTAWLSIRAVLAIGCAVVSTSISTSARAAETVRAVWNVQELYLPYFGLTTHYSCDGLRDRVRDMLKELGVRGDFLVTVPGCIELSGPSPHPTARIILANAVPATDELAKALAADPKRAQLIAKLQKQSKTTFSDEPFDAHAKRVRLYAKNNGASSVGSSGDCELLEQMRRLVLPKLGAQVSNDDVSCTPHQGTVGNSSMDVDLLVAVPAKS